MVSGAEGVLLVQFPDGRASGDGYAVFDSEEDLKAAMEHDRQNISGYSRYVELYRSSVKDLKAVSVFVKWYCDRRLLMLPTPPGLVHFSYRRPAGEVLSAVGCGHHCQS